MNLNFPNFPKETVSEQTSASFRYWFKRIFLDDWLVKLTALVITLTLWLGVTGLQTPTTTRLRGVTLKPFLSNQLEITNSPVKEIELVVTGEKRKVDRLDSDDLVVSLDLTDAKAGESTIKMSPENITVNLPKGVKIDEIHPDSVLLKLEPVEEYEVAIKAETEGSPAAGYEIYSTNITPAKVKVRGPKSSVESLNFILTEKINVDKLKLNFRAQQIPLNVVNPKVTLLDAVSVDVFFRIGKKRIERLFVKPYDTDSRSGKASILLYGPSAVLEKLAIEDLQVIEERKETETVRLSVILPEGMRNEVEVKSVKFRE